MTLKTMIIPVGALVMSLGLSGAAAEAGQRDRNGRDRNGRESQGQAHPRDGGGEQARGGGQPQERGAARGDQAPPQERGGPRAEAAPPRGVPGPQAERRDEGRGGRFENREPARPVAPPRRDYERRDGRRDDGRDAYRYDGYRGNNGRYAPYAAPRIAPGRPRHYYGPGGNFSVYFGVGSGYYYGAPYSGRVYGYLEPRAYGARIYYGDVRLQVRPRDAQVYVDGYYAGIVDDFDGVFQRLTLEVGSHQIEIDAPGLEPQFWDVYVDPTRTVDIRADLFR